MFIIVGLGNPGLDYTGHRHNIGFMAIDAIVHRHVFKPFQKTHFQAQIAEGVVAGTMVLAVKPLTYMNNVGPAVSAVVRSLSVPIGRVVVFHDELDLPPGKVRIKRGGRDAGHKGLRSLDAHMARDYQRVRIGIGHPGQQSLVVRHVLGNFSAQDSLWLKPILEKIAEFLPILLSGESSCFITQLLIAESAKKPVIEKEAQRRFMIHES